MSLDAIPNAFVLTAHARKQAGHGIALLLLSRLHQDFVLAAAVRADQVGHGRVSILPAGSLTNV